ncbi:MAG: LysM peptidoglycan-binding domain-containing protein [bacterium]|nr:LysM peptidoglycan-binding domain-containing protein [bacterium]
MQPWQPVTLRNLQWMRTLCLCVLALLLLTHRSVAQPTSSHFPVPEVLRPNIAFWKHVFTTLDVHTGILHDTTDVSIVYHTLPKLPKHSKQLQRLINRHRRHYKNILLRLAQGKRRHLTRDELRVLALFKGKQTPLVLRAAARSIRFQRGLRERFAKGLTRSGAFLPTIRRIFAAAGLPKELSWLPHVESSFNNRAYSKSNAAGMWQFTRGTGRRFLRIDRAIDERFDFERAAVAAAKLLRANYQELRTWPLAITAYNHGVGGMKRAIARLRTRDFGTIVKRYRSRSFGFASQNFYAEFLAAIDVSQNYQRYFPGLTFDTPRAYHSLTLDTSISLRTLAKHLGMHPTELAKWNPAIRPAVRRGHRSLPKGYTLNIPYHRLSPVQAQARWASIPASAKLSRQAQDGNYRVQPGDTLSHIAQRYRTTVTRLMDLNDINQPHTIKAGQRLRLPAKTLPRVRVAKKPAPTQPTSPQVTIVTATSRFTVNLSSATSSMPDPHLAFRLLMAGFPINKLLTSDAIAWLRAKDSVIQVIATESWGLYAQWLDISIARLRKLNRMPRRRPLRLGADIRLDFSKVSETEFTRRRLLYHQRIEENFFRAYAVARVLTHTLKRGETLWRLARHDYDVPLWLIQKYNHNLDFHSLMPGTKLRIPQVIERAKTS